MKPALAWAKQHWLIVLFVAIVVISLPAGWWFSRDWNAKIKERQEKAARGELTKVDGSKVTYSLPALEPGTQPVSFTTEPNDNLTAWFKQKKDELLAQAREVVRRAEDFNRGAGPEAAALGRREHRPLVDGVFPAVRGGDSARAMFDFEDALLGKRGRPDPYVALITRAQAGESADPVRLADVLADLEVRETQKIKGTIPRELTLEEREKVAQTLLERRLAEYQTRAQEISFYASPSIFPAAGPSGTSQSFRPTEGDLNILSRGGDDIRLAFFFIYQWDLWFADDLLTAARLANTGADGRPTGVERSVVKRLERIAIAKPDGTYSGSGGERDVDPLTGQPATLQPASPGLVPVDPRVSYSGRVSLNGNKVYDVRRATVTAIVSSARLPEFLAAIERTNFMTVTDVDATPVSVYDDLRDGYYYGPEHVVRATIEVESVWLRSWTAPLMPRDLKERLGIEEPPATQPG